MAAPRHILSSVSGAGIGLRSAHYEAILDEIPDIPWLEALTDNYLNPGGRPLAMLMAVREHYPLTLHGVGMSLGGIDPLDASYFKALRGLIDRVAPVYVSDHLCWTHHAGVHSNDLLPMPYTEDALRHVTERIRQVQETLGREILIENVSSYLSYQASEMSEAEFLAEVVQQAGCGLLCDVNNIYVSAHNHGDDPLAYLDCLPKEAIRELHLAGFADQGDFLLDTHGAAVHEEVWQLYQEALARFGPVPTLIEWDTDIPELSVLLAEREKAASLMREVDEQAA